MWGKKPLFGKDPFGPKLKYRIIYTILLVAVFRGLAAIPLINADEKTLNKILAENPIIGVVDLFAGGEVLSRFSIVAAGIFPYLVALAFANTAVRAASVARSESGGGRQEKD